VIFVCAAVIGKAAIAALVLQLGNGTVAFSDRTIALQI
jgi:hypothetical protein